MTEQLFIKALEKSNEEAMHQLIDTFQPTIESVIPFFHRKSVNSKWLQELLQRFETLPQIPFMKQIRSTRLEVLIGFECVDIWSMSGNYKDILLYPIEDVILEYVLSCYWSGGDLDDNVETARLLWKNGSPKPRIEVLWEVISAEAQKQKERKPVGPPRWTFSNGERYLKRFISALGKKIEELAEMEEFAEMVKFEDLTLLDVETVSKRLREIIQGFKNSPSL